jgi:hypothetical protein
VPGTQFTVNIKFADTKPAAAPAGFPQVCSLKSLYNMCPLPAHCARLQAVVYGQPGAYGANYSPYVQQQHADPQAAAYAQYMQQVPPEV